MFYFSFIKAPNEAVNFSFFVKMAKNNSYNLRKTVSFAASNAKMTVFFAWHKE